jgi:hypothetical protein
VRRRSALELALHEVLNFTWDDCVALSNLSTTSALSMSADWISTRRRSRQSGASVWARGAGELEVGLT